MLLKLLDYITSNLKMIIKEYPKKIIKAIVELAITIPFIWIIKISFNDPWIKMLLYMIIRLIIIESIIGYCLYHCFPIRYKEYSTYNLLIKNSDKVVDSLKSHITNASSWFYMRLDRFLIHKYIISKINKKYDIELDISFLGTTTEIFQIKINNWICVFEPDITLGDQSWNGYILMYNNDVLITEKIYYNNRELEETICQIMLVINPNKVLKYKLKN